MRASEFQHTFSEYSRAQEKLLDEARAAHDKVRKQHLHWADKTAGYLRALAAIQLKEAPSLPRNVCSLMDERSAEQAQWEATLATAEAACGAGAREVFRLKAERDEAMARRQALLREADTLPAWTAVIQGLDQLDRVQDGLTPEDKEVQAECKAKLAEYAGHPAYRYLVAREDKNGQLNPPWDSRLSR